MQIVARMKQIAFSIQKLLLWLAYYFFRASKGLHVRDPIDWVIGVTEIASFIKHISTALDNTYSVCLTKNPYYEFQYDFAIKPSVYPFMTNLKIVVAGPILLGRLLNRAENFLYIWSTGFLIDSIDQREFEFNFIKSKKKHIVCYFVGNDIRAPRLLIKYANAKQLEVATHYDSVSAPHRLTDAYDYEKRRLAEVTQKYASVIFNAAVDHMAYFTRKTTPFIYFYPDENFVKNDAKFKNPPIIKIVHAPSSPVIKGTQLVRAAIAKLRVEGYDFEYIELTAVSNAEVLDHLRTAHIVVNEFYAFVPGVLGIEAMASHCALITSADETIETDLPPGSNEAWLVTRPYQVYDHLKMLLDTPAQMKAYADVGYQWAHQHAAIQNSGRKLAEILKNIPDNPH